MASNNDDVKRCSSILSCVSAEKELLHIRLGKVRDGRTLEGGCSHHLYGHRSDMGILAKAFLQQDIEDVVAQDTGARIV